MRLSPGTTADETGTVLESNAYTVITEIFEDTAAEKEMYRWWGRSAKEGADGWLPLYYLTCVDMKKTELSGAELNELWRVLEGYWRSLDGNRYVRFTEENGALCYIYSYWNADPTLQEYAQTSAEGDLRGLVCIEMNETPGGPAEKNTQLYLDLSELADGLTQILRSCSKIFTIWRKDRTAQMRLKDYEDMLVRTDCQDIYAATVRLELPLFTDIPQDPEMLKSCALADHIRQHLKEWL